MKDKLRVMLADDFDAELNALNIITIMLKQFGWDSQWRILNYVIARTLGRKWILPKPAGE